ncbi:YibE/F family protein [Nocardioides hankookensis]|uniref:YibE/F family protein n=1 Tax=Nocardioides hankookensis TaxID=443157 RepID=A0ABW1LEL0_9ACTN
MGAGHSHGSHRAGRDAELEVPRGPRLLLLGALALAGIAAVVGLLVLWPDSARVDELAEDASFAAPGVTFPTATVDTVGAPCTAEQIGSDSDCGRIEVTIDDGAGRGDRATVQVSPQVVDSGLTPGDQVRLQRIPGGQGADATYSYFGTERTRPLLILLAVFVGLVLLVARWRGFFALVGLAFTGVVIWRFVLPALLTGASGVAVGLTAAALIMFVVLYTTHGFSLRTSAALAGTLAGVLVIAGIGVVATGATRLTGIADEQAGILSALVGDLSFHELFACAALIAGLGVLNDVTITQSSAVWELRAASPAMSRARLFASGMRIGRDHIASTIYTIVFAYAGTALAVLLILRLYGLPWDVLLTTEDITEEVVRTLAGSIGLVLAVPLTTAIATLVVATARPAPSVVE